MKTIIQIGFDSLSQGSLIALYTLGIVLIFGIVRLVNFAHASLIMIGGYVLVLTKSLPLPVSVVLTVLICGLAAMLMELVAFRLVRGAAPATLLITSFAVYYLLSSLAQLSFGSLPRGANLLGSLGEPWNAGGIPLSRLSIVTIVVVLVLVGGLILFLRKSTLGRQMRAAAEDFQTARLYGIRANTVISLAFLLSGILAAVAAVLLLAQTGQVDPSFGVNAVVFGLIAAVVGGMRSLPGGIIAAFLLGLGSTVLQRVLPIDLQPGRDAFLFLAVFVLLVLRPQGLWATSDGSRV
jgi:branched-chain amino acid transport system permease protein